MGTRAQFFIGDPRDVEGRDWLGCVGWDGYPEGDIGDALKGVASAEEFIAAVADLAAHRDDFTNPEVNSFPFPWRNDLFLTDCTYALFGGEVHFTSFHRGFIPLATYLSDESVRDAYDDGADELPSNVPAPTAKGPPGPDSILIVRSA